MKKDFIFPVLVLSFICFVMTAALALVNNITAPIIEQAALDRIEEAKFAIIPNAEGFISIENDLFPASVYRAFGTSNNVGYIFFVSVHGYGGRFTLTCGIDPEGRIINSFALAPHLETPGIGTIVFDEAVVYIGKDSGLHGIDTISGATITFEAYRNGIIDAFTAFNIIKEGSN